MAKDKKPKVVRRKGFLFIGRVERNETVDTVSLHLSRPTDVLEVTEGAEYVTVVLEVDPFIPPKKVN
jgi:hypothetical protein